MISGRQFNPFPHSYAFSQHILQIQRQEKCDQISDSTQILLGVRSNEWTKMPRMSRSMGDIWWRERENKTLTNHAFSAKNRSNKEEIYDRAVNEYKRWKRIKLRKKRGKKRHSPFGLFTRYVFSSVFLLLLLMVDKRSLFSSTGLNSMHIVGARVSENYSNGKKCLFEESGKEKEIECKQTTWNLFMLESKPKSIPALISIDSHIYTSVPFHFSRSCSLFFSFVQFNWWCIFFSRSLARFY